MQTAIAHAQQDKSELILASRIHPFTQPANHHPSQPEHLKILLGEKGTGVSYRALQ